jgi:gliding motility-associated-like protein
LTSIKTKKIDTHHYQYTKNMIRNLLIIIGLFACAMPIRLAAQCTASLNNTGPYCPGTDISLLAIASGTSYLWQAPNAATLATTSASNLTVLATDPNAINGVYTVTVTYANGCTASSTTLVTINSRPTAIPSSPNPTFCEGGQLALTVAGGGTAGHYVWAGPNGFASALQSPVINNTTLAASGSYNVTVTNAAGCTNTAAVSIVINAKPFISIAQTGSSCAGNTLNLNATGNNPPLTFNWTGANNFNLTNNPTATLNNVTIADNGNYFVTATDGNGCVSSSSTLVSVATVIAAASNNGAICEGGQAILTATTPTINATTTYAWAGPGGFLAATSPVTRNGVTVADAGLYTVTITTDGCSATATTTLAINTNPTLTVAATDAKCAQTNDGTVTATVVSTANPLNYAWSNGPATIATITGLAPNTYTVTVTDANGCRAIASASITAPAPLSVGVSQFRDALCANTPTGGATATAAGGTMPYSYLWLDGETTAIANTLPCGAGNIIITDANGCTALQNFDIFCPAALQTTDTLATPVQCFGGSDGTAVINMTGGATPYTYHWTTIASNPNTAQVTGLQPGTYPVSVTDANGCPFGPVTVSVVQPTAPLVLTINGTPAICKDGATGTITVAPTGGTAAYNYAWSGAATGVDQPTADGLHIGIYTVTVTDNRACTQTASYTVTEPDSVHVVAHAIPTICYNDDNGFILVDAATGGNGAPYRYALYSPNELNFQSDTIFAGLPASTYIVYAEDSRGCAATTTVRVDQPTPIQLAITNGDTIRLAMGESVQLFTDVNVDPATLQYIWVPNTALDCGNSGTCYNPTVSPLDPQRYTVVVNDAQGCTASASTYVNVQKSRNIFVPNIFTPNNDTQNDVFMVFGGLGVVQIKTFNVFDRWGEPVFMAKNFQPNDPTFGWDGRLRNEPMRPAVFVYYMEVEFVDGKIIPYKGDVTLVR